MQDKIKAAPYGAAAAKVFSTAPYGAGTAYAVHFSYPAYPAANVVSDPAYPVLVYFYPFES